MNALNGHRHAVIDVEGNGQNPPDIIEIAIVPVDNGIPAEPQSWLVRPPTPINPIVTRKVHGIRNEDVADSPSWAQVEPEILAALEGRIPVAHNARVEHEVLIRHMPQWRPATVLDTLRLAKATWPDRKGNGGYGLDALLEYAGLIGEAAQGKRHRAGYDAHATARLFVHLAELQSSYGALLEVSTVPGVGGTASRDTSPQEPLW